MDLSNPRESANLVRMYSWEIEDRVSPDGPADPLVQALVAERKNLQQLAAPWRALLDPTDLTELNDDPITQIVATESQKLRDIWRNHQASGNVSDRLDVDDTDPTVEGIVEIVNKAVASWNGKRKEGWWGKTKEKFHHFCGTVDSHQSILQVIPQSSEYVSIFYGSITAIMKASISHEGVVEDVIEAFDDISRHIEGCAHDLKLYPTAPIKQSVADLYSSIFNFLAAVSDWITKKKIKRIGHSFNESLRAKFQDKITDIQTKSQRIRDVAAQSARVENRVTRLAVDGVSNEVKTLRNSISHDNANMAFQMSSVSRDVDEIKKGQQLLGQQITSLLLLQSSEFVSNMQMREQLVANLSPQALMLAATRLPSAPSLMSIESGADTQTTVASLVEQSRRLEGFFQPGRLRLAAEGFHASTIPPQMLQRLSEWLQEDTTSPSSFLWLRGDFVALEEDQDNALSMLAAVFIDMIQELELPGNKTLPFLSYFCEISRTPPREGNPSREAEGAVAMAYAILRQIMTKRLIGEQLTIDFDNERLEDLDGTIRTWDKAMIISRGLLSQIPSGTLCVIDALHWLDDHQTESKVVEFIRVLRESRMKVLFTTSARSGALLEEMEPHEVLFVEEYERPSF